MSGFIPYKLPSLWYFVIATGKLLRDSMLAQRGYANQGGNGRHVRIFQPPAHIMDSILHAGVILHLDRAEKKMRFVSGPSPLSWGQTWALLSEAV
jgi:hypothetical protein